MKEIKTYIVLERKTTKGTMSTTIGRYKVGAKDEKEALKIIREKLGKLRKFNVYYQAEQNTMKYKEVVKEI